MDHETPLNRTCEEHPSEKVGVFAPALWFGAFCVQKQKESERELDFHMDRSNIRVGSNVYSDVGRALPLVKRNLSVP